MAPVPSERPRGYLVRGRNPGHQSLWSRVVYGNNPRPQPQPNPGYTGQPNKLGARGNPTPRLARAMAEYQKRHGGIGGYPYPDDSPVDRFDIARQQEAIYLYRQTRDFRQEDPPPSKKWHQTPVQAVALAADQFDRVLRVRRRGIN